MDISVGTEETTVCAQCGASLKGDQGSLLICPVCDRATPASSFISNLKPKAKLRFVEGDPSRRTVWLWFYTYIRLPFGAFFLVTAVDRLPPADSILAWLAAAAMIGVAVGLHRRAIWGWQLNWVLLLFESAGYISSMAPRQTLLSAVLVVGMVWVLPNSVYFFRRRHLFGG